MEPHQGHQPWNIDTIMAASLPGRGRAKSRHSGEQPLAPEEGERLHAVGDHLQLVENLLLPEHLPDEAHVARIILHQEDLHTPGEELR
jgi:hypothetical protein